MARINLHISLRAILLALSLLLLVFATAIIVDFLFKEGGAGGVSLDQGALKLTSQKLYFEIDPERSLFLSRQTISFTNSEISRSDLTFLIYPSLIIDRMDFMDANNVLQEVEEWHYGAPVQYPHQGGKVVLNQVQVHFARSLPPNQSLTLLFDYHLARESLQSGEAPNLFELFVSPEIQHAAGFDSGAFPILESDSLAALEIKIRHPLSERCGVPGQLVSEAPDGKFVTETYQSNPGDEPAFSCAAFQKRQKSQDGVTIEFYLAPGQNYSDKMSEIALQYFTLYRRLFGDPESEVFRFVFLGLSGDTGAADAESMGNTVYLPAADSFANFDQDTARQTAFKILVGHAEFHYWSRFSGSWSGSLMDWWSQGGAYFMSAWAGEMLWGKDFGSSVRGQYVTELDQTMQNLAQNAPGLQIPTTGKGVIRQVDPVLTFEYGALVWEQLRQFMGDDALLAGLRDFIQHSPRRGGTVISLIQVLQQHTQGDLTAFLKQWTARSARIDLSIQQVTVQAADDHYESTVVIHVAADQNFNFFTSLAVTDGYSREIQIVPIHITHLGDSIVKFTSSGQPVAFQIDPEVRVPHTNLQNDTWQVH